MKLSKGYLFYSLTVFSITLLFHQLLPLDLRSITFSSLSTQSNQHIVVSGTEIIDQNGSIQGLVFRYDTNGFPDYSFGIGGVVTVLIGDKSKINASVLQPSDEKIVSIGLSRLGRMYRLLLVRHNSDGSLDITFNETGVVTILIDEATEGYGVTVQPSDEKIVAAGFSIKDGKVRTMLTRYNPNGSVDTTFGTNGVAFLSINTRVSILSIALQSDEKIVVVGTVNDSQCLIARYNTDGSVDNSFGTDGIVLTTATKNVQGNAVAIQNDSKILLVGVEDRNGIIIRFNTDGSVDTTFGIGGTTTLTSMQLNAAYIQSDGKLVCVGSIDNSLTVIRLTVTGIVDETFENNESIFSVIAQSSRANAVTVINNDIALCGFADESGIIVYYSPTGLAHPTFGVDGIITKNPKQNNTVIKITDEKLTKTSGGTFSNLGWQTRELNSIVNYSEYVLLVNNQFTLTPGRYYIFASAPAYQVNQHQIRLKNVTNNTIEQMGTNSVASGSDMTVSSLHVFLTVTASTTFELQHRAAKKKSKDGRGIANGFGEKELYTTVMITKL